MNADFPRILTLLRKERGISQKDAAAKLGISQALLSHYEKGIRECGLDFIGRCADFYDVSCDYLLGRSPEPTGRALKLEDIPDSDAGGKENTFQGSIMPILNKKLISNSLNILFDLLSKAGSESLIKDISDFLMISVYRMFRVVYNVNPKNQAGMFTLSDQLSSFYANAAMQVSEGQAISVASGHLLPGQDEIPSPERLTISTDSLPKDYPQFASSLLNLIRNSEKTISAVAPSPSRKK